MAVLSAAALEDFLASLSADAAWASHWAGALVLAHAPGTHLPSNPLPASGALRPGSEAEAPSHAWNPAGTGSVLRALPIPLFSLNASASERVAATLSRAPSTGAGPSPAARMDVRMAVPAGATSEACLAARTCLPLGGHTVWARVGPRGSRPAPVLVAAVQDEASLFHARGGAGAHAGASGLIATLAAARALGRRPPAAGRAPIVFAAFAGEAWGALGSRRLLYQAAAGDADALDPARPARLLEVGRVGCVPGALHVHGADRGTLGTLRAAAAAVPGLRLAEASVGGGAKGGAGGVWIGGLQPPSGPGARLGGWGRGLLCAMPHHWLPLPPPDASAQACPRGARRSPTAASTPTSRWPCSPTTTRRGRAMPARRPTAWTAWTCARSRSRRSSSRAPHTHGPPAAAATATTLRA